MATSDVLTRKAKDKARMRLLGRHAKFGTARAHFGVGRCSTRLGVLENLGVAAGIALLSCSQPELKVLPV